MSYYRNEFRLKGDTIANEIVFYLRVCTRNRTASCWVCTPYSGAFGPGDLDALIQQQVDEENTICLDDRFDTACIRTIRGEKGDRGLHGRSVYTFIFQMPKQRDTNEPAEVVFSDTEAGIEVTRTIADDTLTVLIDVGESLSQDDITVDLSVDATITSVDTSAEIVIEVPDTVHSVNVRVEIPTTP